MFIKNEVYVPGIVWMQFHFFTGQLQSGGTLACHWQYASNQVSKKLNMDKQGWLDLFPQW